MYSFFLKLTFFIILNLSLMEYYYFVTSFVSMFSLFVRCIVQRKGGGWSWVCWMSFRCWVELVGPSMIKVVKESSSLNTLNYNITYH